MTERSSQVARLQWFDANSGEGMVILDGESLFLHFTSITGISKNNYQWPTEMDKVLLRNLKGGEECRVTLYGHIDSLRIDTAEFDLQTILGE